MSTPATRKRPTFQEPGSLKRSKATSSSQSDAQFLGIAAFNSRLHQRPETDTVRDTFISTQRDDFLFLSDSSEASDSTQDTVLSYSRTLNGVEERLSRIENTAAKLTLQLKDLSEKWEACLAKAKGPI